MSQGHLNDELIQMGNGYAGTAAQLTQLRQFLAQQRSRSHAAEEDSSELAQKLAHAEDRARGACCTGPVSVSCSLFVPLSLCLFLSYSLSYPLSDSDSVSLSFSKISLTHSLILSVCAKIYSHAHSPILSLCASLFLSLCLSFILSLLFSPLCHLCVCLSLPRYHFLARTAHCAAL